MDPVYPILYIDALVVKVRDGGHVVNKAAHLVVGVDTDGIKHVLGIWVQSAEGAKFWLRVLAQARRAVGAARLLPAVRRGRRGYCFRRGQVEVIANARESRKLR